MLVDSPRLSEADRSEWSRLARYDRAAATRSRARLERLAEKARTVIGDFHDRVGAYVGVSWGRDSVTVAHLTHGLGLPLIHVTHGTRTDRLGNPDGPAVAAAYLERWPSVYRAVPIETPRAYQWLDAHGSEIDIPPGRVTGLRADESWARAKSRAVHGVTTGRSCRPIIDWTSTDVWLYLALHDLPVHPAYACSFGGLLPRDRLRVSSLGGDRGTDHGRAEWEAHYYPEAQGLRPTGRKYQA